MSDSSVKFTLLSFLFLIKLSKSENINILDEFNKVNIINEHMHLNGDSSSGTLQLYDLTNDPLEDTNLAYYTEYSNKIDYFSQRQDFWDDLTIGVNEPDSTNQMIAWEAAGGVTYWVDTDFTSLNVEQKYSYSDAPNIVFILVDDWGYNDVGLRSTYMSWTTPTFDKLAEEGILLENYYTNEVCAPSRGSLLTGRYTLRLGIYSNEAELPLSETTLAQELQSAGYRTYMVGKWHLGQSTKYHWPTERGFDRFFGFLGGFSTYDTKTIGGYLDLHDDMNLVTDENYLSTDYHAGYLYEDIAESFIDDHALNYNNQPMFLYYAMQLIHEPWTAPDVYLSRCVDTSVDTNASTEISPNYCGMNIMMDEAIANLTCSLRKNGMSDNTIIIISGDNGGERSQSGNSYPFKGHKGAWLRGGISNTALIHSNLIPESSRGSKYTGHVHITDWMPTLMGLATNNEWTGSYSGADIDGVDMWDSIINSKKSPHSEMIFHSYEGAFAMQYHNLKFLNSCSDSTVDLPEYYYTLDLSPDSSSMSCENPSLIQSFQKSSFTMYKSFLPDVEQIFYVYSTLAVIFIFLFVFVMSYISVMKTKDNNTNIEIENVLELFDERKSHNGHSNI